MCIKLATKTLANRLKTIWGSLISPTHGAFVPGRQGVDNIVICQEIVHSLWFTRARRGGMVIKVDMEKAYDRMSWAFIEETLRDTNLPEYLIAAIMHIISTSVDCSGMRRQLII